MFNIIKTTLCFSLCLYASTAFSKVQMSLSQNEIAFGDTVSLIFESDEDLKTTPNLESIEKDFKILGKSQSSNVSIINGSMTKKNQISYTLYPYQKGEFKIGPIEFDSQKFDSLFLKVVDAPTQKNEPTTQTLPSVEFETKVSPKQIYEGQVALYQAKITDENALYDASLKVPFSNKFNFTPLESDKVYQTIKDGKKYRVLERFFIFTPTNSGTFNIPPAQLSGSIPDLTKKRRPDIMGDFFNFPFDFHLGGNMMKPVYFNSNENTIEVLSKPTNWQGWWFPSNKAELLEEYIMPEKIYLGDVIERKITLTATNIENAKLPLLEHPKQEDISIYANQEERFSEFKNNEIVSVENRTFVISFQKEGKQTIPAFTVKYFNADTKSEETLTLPEKEVEVYTNSKVQALAPTKESTPTPPNNRSNEIVSTDNSQTNSISKTIGYWIIGIFSFLTILGVFLAFKKKKKPLKIEQFGESKKNSHKKKRKKPLPDLYPH